MFINIYDEETRGLIRKTNGTETLYFFVLNCLRNQPDLSFSEQHHRNEDLKNKEIGFFFFCSYPWFRGSSEIGYSKPKKESSNSITVINRPRCNIKTQPQYLSCVFVFWSN